MAASVMHGSIHADYAFSDLVDAAKRGDGHAVHKLLELDSASAGTTDSLGYTALHWAAMRGHERIVRELIEAKASVNAVGLDGSTPLHWSCHNDRADIARMLLEAGADVALRDQRGETPLHVAAQRGSGELASLLLARGADANLPTLEGWTPLHVAYRSGHDDLVRLLIEAGADPTRTDATGHLPADARLVRPSTVSIDPKTVHDYVGIYDLVDGPSVKVWRDGTRLMVRAWATDELDPIAPDTFLCNHEPWQVSFHRGEGGAVDAIEIRSLRRTETARRRAQPQVVGSMVCRTCHLSSTPDNPYVSWLRSRHSHAYWRLGGTGPCSSAGCAPTTMISSNR
jgi:ankyrin repeat protein